jgi:hypothetical protein
VRHARGPRTVSALVYLYLYVSVPCIVYLYLCVRLCAATGRAEWSIFVERIIIEFMSGGVLLNWITVNLAISEISRALTDHKPYEDSTEFNRARPYPLYCVEAVHKPYVEVCQEKDALLGRCHSPLSRAPRGRGGLRW